MTAAGTLAGLSSATWRRFRTDVVCVNTSPSGAGLTHPFFDTFDGHYQFGRYMDLDGLIIVQQQVSFVGATTVGAGGPYAFRLPRPMYRGSPHYPIGTAIAYFSYVSPYPNVPVVAVPAREWESLNGQHGAYFSLMADRVLSWGDADFNPGGAEVVTHRCGMTPQASDIQLVPTGTTGSQNVGPPWVSAVGSSSFTANTFSNNTSGGGALPFHWKVDAEPPSGVGGNLVGPYVPWDWTRFTPSVGPFGNLFIELVYEPTT